MRVAESVDALNGEIHRVDVKALAVGISYAGFKSLPLIIKLNRKNYEF